MPCYALEDTVPTLGHDSWIAPDANLIGDVRLDAGASVWFGATIRGDNTPIVVGAGTNIQDGAVLHSDPGYPLTIGARCTVGHRAIVHGCTIGDEVLVGMGATILNGAVIGDGCLIGAGALVTEGKRFAPGQLILGSPASAIRPLDDAARAGLRLSAEHYVARARRFANGLVRVD